MKIQYSITSSQDPTLIILVVAGCINLALSFYEPGIKETPDVIVNATAILTSTLAGQLIE